MYNIRKLFLKCRSIKNFKYLRAEKKKKKNLKFMVLPALFAVKFAVALDVRNKVTSNFSAIVTAKTVDNIAAISFCCKCNDFFSLQCGRKKKQLNL